MTKRLTDAEIDAAWRSVDYTQTYEKFRIAVARAIESAVIERSKSDSGQAEPVAVVELVTQALRAMPDGTWWQQDPQLEIRAMRPVENGQVLYTAPQAVNQRLLEALKHIANDNWPDADLNAAEYASLVVAAERGEA